MYGKYVEVDYQGKIYKIFVLCTPATPKKDIKIHQAALEILKVELKRLEATI